ncbi:hypothetical protein PRIPAC_77734, partial [Pristionchus pacificus]|uniref:G protein-coupled receptor n=1 Tax=Pristionchus pacificus TaxID=54126 RepID=A0A2A6BXI3_PRIPA
KMNETIRPFIYRTQLMDRELFLWNFIRIEYLSNAHGFYYTIVTIEAVFCALAACVSSFFIVRALQQPPMHINPCLITAYDVIVTVISNIARIGQILYESRVGKPPPTIRSALRYPIQCLALRYVRDYERNRRLRIAVLIILLDTAVNAILVVLLVMDFLPFYKVAWIAFFFYFGVYFGFNRLLAQNEKRLERLNRRIIKRPSAQGGLGKLPKKFFGDSAKDMYTLSLRLQLDENIWCCKQLSRGSYIFVIGLTTITLIEIVIVPLHLHSRDYWHTNDTDDDWEFGHSDCQHHHALSHRVVIGQTSASNRSFLHLWMVRAKAVEGDEAEPEGDIWMIHFIQKEHLTGLNGFYLTIVCVEALCCVMAVLLSIFLMMQGLRHPPVHVNLVLVTAYYMSWIAMSNATRAGLILYESGILPFTSDDVPLPCLVLSFLRLYGVVSVTRFSIVIYVERCLALRYVRDYEYYLPGYRMAIFSVVVYIFFYFAIKNLYAQNELRLEHLNERSIRRPSAASTTGFGKFPKKFFGDHSKDMYTLSLRLQLDENIWCCRQISEANRIFVTGIVSATLFVTVPPLLSYTKDSAWVLMVLATVGNLIIPIFTIAITSSIAWSLDKMKPLIVPSFVFERYQSRKRNRQLLEKKRSGRVTIQSQIEPDSESRYSLETKEYFSQLSSQWNKSFDSIYM